jgi:hypothetical protein
MTMGIERELEASRRRHVRDIWLKIVLPFVAGLLILVLLTALVSIMRSAAQISITADVLVTLLLLCPLALCTLPFSIGLMTLAVMSGRLHGYAKRPLRRGEALSLRMRQRTEVLGERIARASISLNARFAPVGRWMDRLLSLSERVEHDEVDHGNKS